MSSMTPAEIAVSLMRDHDPTSIPCGNVRGATTILDRGGFNTVESLGYGTRTWLCATRKGVKHAFTAVARWQDGQLWVWGELPVPPGKQLSSDDVGQYGHGVRLPAAIWAWVVEQLGEEIRKGERSAGPAIRRAFIKKKT